MDKLSLEDYKTIFANDLRYYILKYLLINGYINSNDIVKILKAKDICSTKPTIFRHLIALENAEILEYTWDITNQSPPKAVKKYEMKKNKRELIKKLFSNIA